jgi:Rrf2 family protein
VRVTARLSYGLGALVHLAAAGQPLKGDVLAERQGISTGFLENILADLRRAGLLRSKRGGRGGYWLARSPAEVTVADVIRALDGTASAPAPDDLMAVWGTITRAYLDAADSITLAELAAAGPRPDG